MIDRLMFSTVLAGLCALGAITALEASRIAPREVSAAAVTAPDGQQAGQATPRSAGARLAWAAAAPTDPAAR